MRAENDLRLVLVRQAESEFSSQGRMAGDVDVPLTERGRTASRRILDGFPEVNGDVSGVYTAGNQAARETAEILAEADGRRVRVLPDLRGISLGLWEGQLVADVRDRHGRIFAQWSRDPTSITPPEGEEMKNAFARAKAAARTIRRKHRKGTVVVVAPDAVIALLVCHLTGRTPDRVFEVMKGLDPVEVVNGHEAG